MRRRVIDAVHDAGRRLGLDVVRYQPTSHQLARRMQLLRSHGVDLVLDIGASDGEFATQMRQLGYPGRIVSFEPIPEVADRLRVRAEGDPAWETRATALGSSSGSAIIHIAGNSSSSSLLSMMPAHERYAPGTRSVGEAEILVERLDDIADEVVGDADFPYLKIDTQGFESEVLDGAATTLERIVGLQVELSIVPLYEEAPLYIEMVQRLADAGFVLMGIEPGFSDQRTGRLLQFDGVFFRSGLPD